MVALIMLGAAVWLWQPWEKDEDLVDLGKLPKKFRGSACRELAGVAAKVAERGEDPQEYLLSIGRQAAGIRRPPRAFADLARGGRDRIPGRGFRNELDDGTRGQVRHFAGVVVATTFEGGPATRFISRRIRRDRGSSPDGRLTEKAIEFASAVLEGELDQDQAPQWLLDNLCSREP